VKFIKKYRDRDKDRITISLMQYYYIAFWMPIFLPPFIFVYSIARPHFTTLSPLFYSVVFGTAQYVPFALWNIFKFRNAVTRDLYEFSFKAPIAFVPFYATGFLLAHMYSSITLPSIDSILILLVFSLLSVPVGYFYVALAHLIARFLQKIGFIEQEFL